MKHTHSKKITLAVCAVLLLCAVSASAHPPHDMNIEFNDKTSEVTVSLTHVTTAPDWHFISLIEVFVNDIPVRQQTFTKQEQSNGLTYTTRLRGIRPGDVISAKAHCSRNGIQTSQIVVSE